MPRRSAGDRAGRAFRAQLTNPAPKNEPGCERDGYIWGVDAVEFNEFVALFPPYNIIPSDGPLVADYLKLRNHYNVLYDLCQRFPEKAVYYENLERVGREMREAGKVIGLGPARRGSTVVRNRLAIDTKKAVDPANVQLDGRKRATGKGDVGYVDLTLPDEEPADGDDE